MFIRVWQNVCVVRLCSWLGFYKNVLHVYDDSGKDAIVHLEYNPKLKRVWLPALVLPVD